MSSSLGTKNCLDLRGWERKKHSVVWTRYTNIRVAMQKGSEVAGTTWLNWCNKCNVCGCAPSPTPLWWILGHLDTDTCTAILAPNGAMKMSYMINMHITTHTCTRNLPIFHNMHQTMTTHNKYNRGTTNKILRQLLPHSEWSGFTELAQQDRV